MAKVESITPYLEPLRKSVIVRRTPAEAFEVFTARFGSWWPFTKLSIHQAETASCHLDPRAGGEIGEVAKNGERAVWGKVLVWEPPHRLVLAWHPGYTPDTAQEVELRFTAVPEGTRVDLEHRDWSRRGEKAAEVRNNYDNGWAFVFEQCFVEACT